MGYIVEDGEYFYKKYIVNINHTRNIIKVRLILSSLIDLLSVTKQEGRDSERHEYCYLRQ